MVSFTGITRPPPIRENRIEARLVKGVKARGALCNKIKDRRSWPDREMLWHEGEIHYAECKKPKGSRFQPLQLRKHRTLRARGFVCVVLFTFDHVDAYLAELDRCRRKGLRMDPNFNPSRGEYDENVHSDSDLFEL